MTNVAFAYANPRRGLLEGVRAGREPDTPLLGLNHLAEHGIDAWIEDPFEPGHLPGLARRALWTGRELPLAWRVRRADVLVTPLTNMLPLAVRAVRGPRVVVVNYGLNLIHRRASVARRRLLAAALRAADRVLCFGRGQADELLGWSGLPAERVLTIPLGIDAGWFAPAPPDPERRFVLAVGKDLGRDYATFAEAMAHVDAEAEIIAYPRNLEGITLPPNVRARRVGSDELRRLYAAATCVVVPQHAEGYVYGAEGGLTVLLEAMAAARPVVATDRSIVREYATDGVEVLLVPAGDANALAAAVRRVLDDRAVAHSLAGAARARVEQTNTTTRFAAALAPVLHELARR